MKRKTLNKLFGICDKLHQYRCKSKNDLRDLFLLQVLTSLIMDNKKANNYFLF